jgi:hypothetical protein
LQLGGVPGEHAHEHADGGALASSKTSVGDAPNPEGHVTPLAPGANATIRQGGGRSKHDGSTHALGGEIGTSIPPSVEGASLPTGASAGELSSGASIEATSARSKLHATPTTVDKNAAIPAS